MNCNRGCFPCFLAHRSKETFTERELASPSAELHASTSREIKKQKSAAGTINKEKFSAQTFTFRELATATKSFRQECLVGEGKFGRVYKGTIQKTQQVVAVKQLDRNGLQGHKEFIGGALKLSVLHHQNLVNLIGYCADGDQRLLVYEFMSRGSLEEHILDMKPDQKPLDWYTRMKIAFGTCKGLEYLHEKVKPPIIYRDLKSSNVLLDEDFNPKLSHFGLAKLGPLGDKMNVSSRVMGTYGYCAPEYIREGSLTLKSDVYSFGVVLLELITGRRAIDTRRPIEEQNLVTWAQPKLRDTRRFPDMADPLLEKKFPGKELNQTVAIAAMCLQEEPGARPFISDVVTALSFLSMIPPPEPIPSSLPAPSTPSKREDHQDHQDTDSSDHDDSEDVDTAEHDDDAAEDMDSAEHEDAESEEHRGGGSGSGSGDCSDYEEGENVDDEEDERHRGTRSLNRKSSKRSRSRRSRSVSYSSGENSSRRSRSDDPVAAATSRRSSRRSRSSVYSEEGSGHLRYNVSRGRSVGESIHYDPTNSCGSVEETLSLDIHNSNNGGSQDGSAHSS